ncbi:MAG: nucleotidyltransferase domain-containing protein [Methanomicrobiales archaeon]
MVLKLEQFNLEDLATKNSMKLLRFLTLNPNINYGLSDLSNELKISKSNLLRIIRKIEKHKLILEHNNGRKKVYQINYQHNTVNILWKLFMDEKRNNLEPKFKNIIDLIYYQVKEEVDLFIIFGSVAQGLATKKSDIDICIVSSEDLELDKFEYLPHRLEIHRYEWEDIKNPVDFVVLESLLNGIVLKGNILKIIGELNTFPQSYLIYRLEKVKEFMKKSETLKNEAKEYYKNLALTTIGEIDSLLSKGKTIPKRKIKPFNLEKEVKELERKISKEGEEIWLV